MQDCESNGLGLSEKDRIDPSSCSVTDNPLSEDLSADDEINFVESAYKSILDEIVEDAIWDVCFEVHRAVKLGYFFMEDSKERNNQIVADSEKDIFGQALKSLYKPQTYQISCPICQNKSCATKFASHLAKCIGISGRNSSRAASQKIAASNDLDENDYDSDSSFKANKKRTKKSAAAKKNYKRKAKFQGNSISEANANYQEMTHEQRKSFFTQMCGVISKRTNKMCMKTHKCSQHTDDQRRDVRHFLLRDMSDQLMNDGQIDVDTVDEGNNGLAFFMETSPSYSSPEKHISSLSDFSETKPSTSSKNGTSCFKKTTDFSPSNSVSSPSQITASGNFFESV